MILESDEEDNEFICTKCNKKFEYKSNVFKVQHQKNCTGLKQDFESNNDDLEFFLSNIKTTEVSIIEKEIFLGDKYDDLNNVEEADLSNRELKIIINKKKVDFKELKSLLILNISNNLLTSLVFLQCIKSLKELNVSYNKIESLLPLEELTNISKLNVSNNNISVISSLTKLNILNELDISYNNITYATSSLKIIKGLKKLKNLSISNNPFLVEIANYKYVFINKFKNLDILDNQKITEVEVDLAKKYVEDTDFNNTWHGKSFLGKNLNNEENCEIAQQYKKIEFQETKEPLQKIINLEEQIKVKGKTLDKVEYKSIKTTLVEKKPTQFQQKELLSNSKLISLEEENKKKQLKIESLQIQLENLSLINNQLENNNRELKDQLDLKKPIIQNKDKYLKNEMYIFNLEISYRRKMK